MDQSVQWLAPSPLWVQTTTVTDPVRRAAFGRPAILRFATDTFMNDFLSLMERDPVQLNSLVAVPETWRGPLPLSPAAETLQPAVPMSSLARKLNRLRLIADRARGGTAMPAVPGTQPTAGSAELPSLKLYQPAHQRYYLVTASLVCSVAGFPNKTIDSGKRQRATFVVRRLIHPDPARNPAADPEGSDEFAYVNQQNGFGWRKVPSDATHTPTVLLPGEEEVPMFAVTFDDDQSVKRRILAGLVPVGKKEAYMAAPLAPPDGSTGGGPLPKTARKIHFRTLVTEPWKRLIDRAYAVRQLIENPEKPFELGDDPEITSLITSTREMIQVSSWLILTDLSKYFEQHMPDVWSVVKDPGKSADDLAGDAQKALFSALKNTAPAEPLTGSLLTDWNTPSGYSPDAVAKSLLEALRSLNDPAKHWIDNLENTTIPYHRVNPDPAWPSFLFPLADPRGIGPSIPDSIPPLGSADAVDSEVSIEEEGTPDQRTLLQKESQAAQDNIDKLVALVVRALPVDPVGAVPGIPAAAQPIMDTREGWFALRCVFETPDCGPLNPALVSERSQVFQMAGFFDPDAPARPVRIALPIDTSPAGLRKFDKNTAFMISDVLCGQINRVKGLTLGDLIRSVLPWPLHKDLSVPEQGPCADAAGNQAGMICSISIPIITICALMLLMIIVNLLDIIFRWVPFFIMCFPLPGFKAKK